MTDTVCPSCDNWYWNHDPECVVATTIHAIWAVSFSPDKAGSPPAWNQAIETILVDNAARVADALNAQPPADQPQGRWTLREGEAWIIRDDGAEVHCFKPGPGTDPVEDAFFAHEMAAALNGTQPPADQPPHVSIDDDLVGYADWFLAASARRGAPLAGWITLIRRLAAALNGTPDLSVDIVLDDLGQIIEESTGTETDDAQ